MIINTVIIAGQVCTFTFQTINPDINKSLKNLLPEVRG